MASKYWVGGNGAWSQPVYAGDTFTGTAGTALDGRTATTGGGTWIKNPGITADSFVQDGSNRIYHNSSGTVEGQAVLNSLISSPDYTVSMDITALSASGSTEIGVTGRGSNATENFYLCQFSGNGIQLYKCINGSYTAIGSSYSYTPTVGVAFTLQLFMSGQTLAVYLNGTAIIVQTDSTFSGIGGSYAGVRASLQSGSTTGMHGGNFKAESLNWATSSGGAPGAAVPTTGDAVIIDSNSSNSSNIFTIQMDTTATIGSFTAGWNSSFGYHEDTVKSVTLNWPGNNPISVAGNVTINGDIALSGISGQGGFIITAAATYTQYTTSYLPYLGINAPGATVGISSGTSGGAGSWYSSNTTVNYLDLLAGTLTLPEYDSLTGHSNNDYSTVTVDTLSVSNSTSTRVLTFDGSSVTGSVLFVSTLIDASVSTGFTLNGLTGTINAINFSDQSRLITDNFVGTSGTDLASHIADDGSTWTGLINSSNGAFLIDGNNMVYPSTVSTGVAYYRNNTPIAVDDYSVTADMYMPQDILGEAGIMGRMSGFADTGYMFRFNGTPGQWELYGIVTGTYTLLATNGLVGTIPANGSTTTMKLTMIGSQISCYVTQAGVTTLVMQVNDNTVSGAFGSYAGFRANTLTSTATTGFHFDNFHVDRLNTYPATMQLKGGGASWPPIYGNYGNLTITGNNTLASLQNVAGTVTTLTGSNTIPAWNIIPGTAWVLGAGQTQTVTFGPNASGTNKANVSLSSTVPGTQALLALTTNYTESWWSVKDVKVIAPFQIQVYRGVNLGDNTNVIFVVGQNKAYAYDVYSYSGTYVGQIIDSIQDPEVSQEINTPGGQVTIRRGVDPINFGENTLIAFNNKIIMRVFTDDYPNGVVYFVGFIADYTPNMEPDNQYVDVIALPYGATLNNILMITDPTIDVQNGSDPSTYPAHQQSDSATYLAQKWTAGSGVTNLTSLQEIWLQVGTGFGNQNMYYEICPDNSGSPDRTKILSSGNLNEFLNFPSPVTLTPGSAYYFIVHGDPGYQINSYACVSGGTGNKLMTSSTGSNGSWSNESHGYTMANYTTYTATGNTQVAYTSTNVAAMITDIMRNYNIQGGPVTIAPAGLPTALSNVTGVTYTFQTNTVLQGLNKCLDFCPAGWYWFVDQATGYLYFEPMATSPTHYLTLGKDIVKAQLQKTMETVVNDLLVTGGDDGSGYNLYRRYYNVASINRYGRRQDTYNDTQLTVAATADIIGNSSVNATKNPTQRSSIDVFSYPTGLNNTGGYNIESMRPGDVLFIQGLPNAVNLQISRIDYLGYYATIDVTDIPPQLNVQAQNIADGLAAVQVEANPTAPTVVIVP